jgi:glycosyltransferase involved in cell wall biosynthesis
VNLLMTHGYMFSGSGSNVYVQNLCRALVREGHDVHLLCQEPSPLSYDFVAEHLRVDGTGTESLGTQESPYPGRCAVYNPRIGDLLPVYVYDDYEGWRVKTFLDLTEEELTHYLQSNSGAIRTMLGLSDAEGVVTNHSVPGPLIARRALEGTSIPYVSIVHGSCLQYVSRRSEAYMDLTREGLAGAKTIVALSTHSAGTIAEDFPKMEDRSVALPGGVDTDLFRPDALDLGATGELVGGRGRGPEAEGKAREAIGGAGTAQELAVALRAVASSYDARTHDRDAGERLVQLVEDGRPIVVYVGKLIHSKGVHALISAFAHVRRETGARLLIIGYGTFREGLQALTRALGEGDRRAVELIAASGRLLEGGPEGPLEHFTVSNELIEASRGLEDDVEFVGLLYHEELSRVLPEAETAVVPSIFPETFGLVAAEEAACGVPPFVADHSGLREAGALVGRGLPFETRVGLEAFEENLVRALTAYLSLPDDERERCRKLVRRNAVEDLGWEALAERLVGLFGR